MGRKTLLRQATCSGRAVLKREGAVQMQWGAVSVPSAHDDGTVPRRPMDSLVEHNAACRRRRRVQDKHLPGDAMPRLAGRMCLVRGVRVHQNEALRKIATSRESRLHSQSASPRRVWERCLLVR